MTATSPRPTTDRRRVRFACSQTVHAEPEAIFPLLCPVLEYDWVPGWDCRLVYTESGVAEPGCVFQTDKPGDGGVDTWVVSHYEPDKRIEFVRVNRLRTIQYDIHLEPAGDGSTRLLWEQTITALDEAGDRHVDGLREEDFARMIESLEAMIEHYLSTGEMLEAAH